MISGAQLKANWLNKEDALNAWNDVCFFSISKLYPYILPKLQTFCNMFCRCRCESWKNTFMFCKKPETTVYKQFLLSDYCWVIWTICALWELISWTDCFHGVSFIKDQFLLAFFQRHVTLSISWRWTSRGWRAQAMAMMGIRDEL